jgi:hypothetical protein
MEEQFDDHRNGNAGQSHSQEGQSGRERVLARTPDHSRYRYDEHEPYKRCFVSTPPNRKAHDSLLCTNRCEINVQGSTIGHIESVEDGHCHDNSQRRWRNQKKSGRIAVAG